MSVEVIARGADALVRDREAQLYFAQLVAAAHAAPAPPLSVEALRDAARAFARGPLAHRAPPHIECEDIDLPCAVRARWYRGGGAHARRPLLYLHGGGYVCGGIDIAHGLAAQIAAAFDAPLLAVGYRQAPEHPIPAALVDTHAAYSWLTTQTDAPVALIGDSAGGQLALAAAVTATKAGLKPPRAAIAISPWLDLSMRTPSWRGNVGRDFSTPEMGAFFRDAYLGGRPIAAAHIADGDLTLLPPMLVAMGGAELALDDADAFVARARRAGRACDYDIYEALPHNFVRYVSGASTFALKRMAAWLNAR